MFSYFYDVDLLVRNFRYRDPSKRMTSNNFSNMIELSLIQSHLTKVWLPHLAEFAILNNFPLVSDILLF